MKKTAIAIFALTGMLLAGCSAVPSANIIPQQAEAAVQQEQEITVQEMPDILFSDSIESEALPQEEPPLQAIQTGVQRADEEAAELQANAVDKSVERTAVQQSKERKTEEPAPQLTEKPVVVKQQPEPKPQTTMKPVASATLEIKLPKAEDTEQESTPEPMPEPTATPIPTPTEEPKPELTPEPTEEPTPEPTSEPQADTEVMGGSFNSAVLDAVNEARALSGNAPLSLDSGLCAQALSHAKEMAQQGKIFHGCGGVESVSDSNESGRLIGMRSAIHASDLELNAGLTSLGVGSVKINGKQYTCVIGR